MEDRTGNHGPLWPRSRTRGRAVHAVPVRSSLAPACGASREFPGVHGSVTGQMQAEGGPLKLEATGAGLVGLILGCNSAAASEAMDGCLEPRRPLGMEIHCAGNRHWLGDVEECDRASPPAPSFAVPRTSISRCRCPRSTYPRGRTSSTRKSPRWTGRSFGRMHRTIQAASPHRAQQDRTRPQPENARGDPRAPLRSWPVPDSGGSVTEKISCSTNTGNSAATGGPPSTGRASSRYTPKPSLPNSRHSSHGSSG